MDLHRLRNVSSPTIQCFPGLTTKWLKKQRLDDYGPPPWAPVRKPLADCTVALVTTAGIHLKRTQRSTWQTRMVIRLPGHPRKRHSSGS
jgi:hypothetical protein